MTRIVIKRLVWDDWNREHIKKHKVTVEEVEDAMKQLITHLHGYKNRYMLLCRTGTRILAIVVGREKPTEYYPISARDADKKERGRVYEKEKQNTRI